MRTCLPFLLVAVSGPLSSALLLNGPNKKSLPSLVEQRDGLIPRLARKQWAESSHDGMHMLARGQPDRHRRALKHPVSAEEQAPERGLVPAPAEEAPVEGCIVCFGAQNVYGKYRSMEGDQKDNSYYLFKNPTHRARDAAHKAGDKPLPVIIQFHPGGFVSGEPSTTENNEIKAYLSKGFAVVSVGCRRVTEKYVYETKESRIDVENKTEELIRVAKDGKLSLDSTGLTMEDYQVRVGKQEFITKFLYDATQMIEHLIDNADDFGLDMNRIVFVGESFGGAAIQYLTWVYHKWNMGRYTPRGMVYHNAQLNYPVHNMLGESWDLFVETMGPQVKLGDVVSVEACPTVVGSDMCEEQMRNTSAYDLCNEEWNANALRDFCDDELQSKTLEQVRSHLVWPREDKTVGRGMEKLWYTSENMQRHKPSEPFYIYVANSKNGTSAEDISQHSIFALSYAKFAEMGDHGGHQYTVYYTDFAHMSKEDRGMKRLSVSDTPSGLGNAPAAAGRIPPAFNAPASADADSLTPSSRRSAIVNLRAGHAGPFPGPMPGPAPAPAPMPAPANDDVATTTVLNYLSTHAWREDLGADDVDPGSLDEQVLYACLAAGVSPFEPIKEQNKTRTESVAHEAALPGLSLLIASLLALVSCSP